MSAKWEKSYVGELKIPTAVMKRPLHQAASRSYNEKHPGTLKKCRVAIPHQSLSFVALMYVFNSMCQDGEEKRQRFETDFEIYYEVHFILTTSCFRNLVGPMTWKLMEDCTKASLGNDVSRVIGSLTQPEKLANDCGLDLSMGSPKGSTVFSGLMGW